MYGCFVLRFAMVVARLLSKNKLTDEVAGEGYACDAELALPGRGVRLNAEVAVISARVEDREERTPENVVHSCRGIVYLSASCVGCALNMYVRDALTPIRELSEVVLVAIVGVGSVILDVKLGKLAEHYLPMFGGYDEIVPIAVLDGDLNIASLRALDEAAEKFDRVYVVAVEADALVVVCAADEGLGAKCDGGIEERFVAGTLFGVDLAVFHQIVIPTSDAGNVDAGARNLCGNAILCGNERLRFLSVIAADLNKFEATVANEIEAFGGIFVLYSAESHKSPPKINIVYNFSIPYSEKICYYIFV